MSSSVEQDRNDHLVLLFIRNLIETDPRFLRMKEEDVLNLIKTEGHYNTVVRHVAKTHYEQSKMSVVTNELLRLLNGISTENK